MAYGSLCCCGSKVSPRHLKAFSTYWGWCPSKHPIRVDEFPHALDINTWYLSNMDDVTSPVYVGRKFLRYSKSIRIVGTNTISGVSDVTEIFGSLSMNQKNGRMLGEIGSKITRTIGEDVSNWNEFDIFSVSGDGTQGTINSRQALPYELLPNGWIPFNTRRILNVEVVDSDSSGSVVPSARTLLSF